MKIESSFRINLLAAKGEDDFGIAMDMEDWLTEHGVLLPDPRLQAIADAWGSLDALVRARSRYDIPAVADLLDSLAKKADDDS